MSPSHLTTVSFGSKHKDANNKVAKMLTPRLQNMDSRNQVYGWQSREATDSIPKSGKLWTKDRAREKKKEEKAQISWTSTLKKLVQSLDAK